MELTVNVTTPPRQPGCFAGETWGHASTTRIVLFWDQRMRCATLYKSPTLKEITISYQVTASARFPSGLRQWPLWLAFRPGCPG